MFRILLVQRPVSDVYTVSRQPTFYPQAAYMMAPLQRKWTDWETTAVLNLLVPQREALIIWALCRHSARQPTPSALILNQSLRANTAWPIPGRNPRRRGETYSENSLSPPRKQKSLSTWTFFFNNRDVTRMRKEN